MVEDRIRVKTQSWKQKFLSQAGRATLIQYVLTAIPSYSMAIFGYPKQFCARLNSLISNFWWRGNDDSHKIR